MSTSYREILKNEFALRRKRNPLYSLRAFARDLQISSARLSEILNGKRGLSHSSAGKIAERLGFSDFLRSYFCALSDSEHARSQAARDAAKLEAQRLVLQIDRHKISLEHIEFISNWYHVAILELTKQIHFNSKPSWIAKTLQVPLPEIKEALRRLEKLGLLKIENGKMIALKDVTSSGSSPPEKRSEGLKRMHLDINELARKAIEAPLSPRKGVLTNIVSMDLQKLPEFKDKMVQFSREFGSTCDQLKNKEEVYCLYMQIFPVSNSKP